MSTPYSRALCKEQDKLAAAWQSYTVPNKAFVAPPLVSTEGSENISIYANFLEMQRFYSLPLEVVIFD